MAARLTLRGMFNLREPQASRIKRMIRKIERNISKDIMFAPFLLLS
jgi:hypothetical protein